jgi:hypothetical protein
MTDNDILELFVYYNSLNDEEKQISSLKDEFE